VQVGYLDPWRTNQQLEAERIREMAQLIELRGQAPEEVAARETYLDLLGIGPGTRVLDVGCGSGVVTRAIAARGATVLGIDPNPGLLEIASEHAPEIRFEPGDALTLQKEQFDVVVSITVLEHMPSAQQAVPNLVRAVKPGGRIGIMCGDQDSFVVAHPDRALTRRIVASFTDARFANPWIGRDVPGLLARAGVKHIQVRAFPTLDRDPTRFAGQAARLRADIAHQTGAITAEERDRWLDQLEAQRDSFLAGALYLFSWGTVER
jgi:SAM-dependent methyltransferase